jgi:hypothetical protein
MIVVVGNGNCASTCSLFTTAMFERHQTKIAVFGGNHSQPIQYKGTSPYTMREEWVLTFSFAGMAGNQVLEWADLDTEIKTAGLKDVRMV